MARYYFYQDQMVTKDGRLAPPLQQGDEVFKDGEVFKWNAAAGTLATAPELNSAKNQQQQTQTQNQLKDQLAAQELSKKQKEEQQIAKNNAISDAKKQGANFWYDAQTNSYIDVNTGKSQTEKPMGKPTAGLGEGIQTYDTNGSVVPWAGYEEKKAKQDLALQTQQANEQATGNLGYLAKDSPIDNPIAQIVPLREDFIKQKNSLQANAENPLGMGEMKKASNATQIISANTQANAANPLGLTEQDLAKTAITNNMGASDVEKALRQSVLDKLNSGLNKEYERAMYESQAGQLRSDADILKQQQAADLAARGLGMSTVVNDVQGATNRDLLTQLGLAANKATVGAQDLAQNYWQNALTGGTNLESNIANRGLQGATQLSNVGAQKQNIYNSAQSQDLGAQNQLANLGSQQQNLYQNAQSPYTQAIQYQDANQLLNLGLQNQAWKDKVANAQYLLGLPQQVSSGQNQTQATAASIGSNMFNTANQTAQGQNQLAGQLGSQIAAAMKQNQQPQTAFVPLQQVGTNATNTAQKIAAGVGGFSI